METPFGRYTLIRKLATGGMAEVFLARADGPMGFQKRCVVKRILPHFSDDPQFVQMFLGEARLAAELNHPNLVQIFDFGEVNGQYFIAMEFIEGPNLRVLNRELRVTTGPLPMAMAARIITLAAEGLHFAHELKDDQGQLINLVHRDISPDNILVSRQGGVKVVDFGIAKAANQVNLTKSGMIKGKLAYMPPEQLAREPLDRRADIYALGVVLYELVCGEMPFDATSEVSIIQALMGQEPLLRAIAKRPDVPPPLDDIIARCLEKDPGNRFPSCRELQVELEHFVQSSRTVVTPGDIAAVVEQTYHPEVSASAPNPLPTSAGTDPTLPRQSIDRKSGSQPKPVVLSRPSQPKIVEPPTVPVTTPVPNVSATQLRAVAPNRTGLYVGLAVVAIGAVGGAIFALKPAAASVVDAGIAVVTPPVVAPPVEVVDAGAPKAMEPAVIDAGQAVVEVDAGVAAQPVAAMKTGRLELRVRPYATVSVDGKPEGDTPLPPLTLPVGKHKVRLINSELDKDVVLDVTVRQGDNVLKYNFKE
jgi:eukaryotic-like serine/threonine-protein kinase